MNLDFSPEDLAFRDEVRRFIEENYPAAVRSKQESGEELGREDFLAWHRILGARGWSAPAWPVEYGGPGWSSIQKFIFAEELARAGTVPILPFGINMVAPVIQAFSRGTTWSICTSVDVVTPRTNWIVAPVYGETSVPVTTLQGPLRVAPVRSRARMSSRVSQSLWSTSSQAAPKSAVRA